jgi:hypothetical protein
MDHRKHDTPKESSERYMNAYERAHARQHMEQAMALADWSIRAWDGIRSTLNRVGNALRHTFTQDRQGAIDATVRRG